ncbi:MAG: nuclear protein [Bathelium mastoideum]|nr:MAG: nuclear protein [Bathelium mastoideum]
MARLNLHRSSSVRPESSAATSRRTTQHSRAPTTLSPSPATSSDKENRDLSREITPTIHGKGKGIMAPPKLPTPNSEESRSAKRRRLEEHDSLASEMEEEQRPTRRERDVKDVYDPDQPMEERQQIRKSLRELHRDLNDNRDELVQPNSSGLLTALHKANNLYSGVRQTSDATIDSRLLVTIGDYASKRAQLLAHGDGALGVDVDEFVSKCITFMRHGGPPSADDAATPAPRRRTNGLDGDASDGDDDEDGDALDWDVLGRRACFPHTRRPPAPSFLLGPLAVQKRVRAPIQRRARQSKKNEGPTMQPEVLQKEDLQQQENSSLVILCGKIRDILIEHLNRGWELDAQVERGEVDEEEAQEMMKELRLADNGDVPLFDFVINPHSFGQTVENIFYVSFLIREGSVRVAEDSNGLPTLAYEEPRSLEEQREKQVTKHQAVFALDFDTWQQLIDVFQIREPIIPHRAEDQASQLTARGWYG